MVSNKTVSKGDDMVSKIGGKDIWGIGKTCNKIFTTNTIKITVTKLEELQTTFNQLLADALNNTEIQQEFIKMWNNPIHRYSTGYLYFVLLFVAKYGSDKDCQARLRDFAVAFDIFIKQDIKDTKKTIEELEKELEKTQSTLPSKSGFGRKKVEDPILIAKKTIFNNLITKDYVDLKVDINEVIESIKFLYKDFKTCPIVKMFDGLVKIEKGKILFLTPTKDKTTGKTNYIYDSATIKNDFVFVLDNLLKFLTVAKEARQINNSSSSKVTKKKNMAENVILYFFAGVYFIGETFVSAVKIK